MLDVVLRIVIWVISLEIGFSLVYWSLENAYSFYYGLVLVIIMLVYVVVKANIIYYDLSNPGVSGASVNKDYIKHDAEVWGVVSLFSAAFVFLATLYSIDEQNVDARRKILFEVKSEYDKMVGDVFCQKNKLLCDGVNKKYNVLFNAVNEGDKLNIPKLVNKFTFELAYIKGYSRYPDGERFDRVINSTLKIIPLEELIKEAIRLFFSSVLLYGVTQILARKISIAAFDAKRKPFFV